MAARRAGVLLIVATLALGVGAALAGAKKQRSKWPSKVSLSHPSSTVFEGRVKSKLRACRAQRLVTLYYTDPQTGQTLPLLVDRTNKKGRYEMAVATPAYPGGYQARLSKEKIRAMKAPRTCKGAKSGFHTF
jgi:hypothetical protein